MLTRNIGAQRIVQFNGLKAIAIARFCHSYQQVSRSINKVLLAIAPNFDYEQNSHIQNGEMAMAAVKEAINENGLPERKREIKALQRRYCTLDTQAIVRILAFFRGFRPG